MPPSNLTSTKPTSPPPSATNGNHVPGPGAGLTPDGKRSRSSKTTTTTTSTMKNPPENHPTSPRKERTASHSGNNTMRPSFDAGEGNGYDQDIHQSQGTGVLVQDDDHLGEQNWTSGDPSKQGKGKDLSHVPCRFFKAGACTAGAACPFSHTMPEVGQQKQTCQWFLKGNCRFGHKCALAHLLAGETYAMDRKNKKAAQLASQQSKQGGQGQDQGQGLEQSRSPPGSGTATGQNSQNNRNRDDGPNSPGMESPMSVSSVPIPATGDATSPIGSKQSQPLSYSQTVRMSLKPELNEHEQVARSPGRHPQLDRVVSGSSPRSRHARQQSQEDQHQNQHQNQNQQQQQQSKMSFSPPEPALAAMMANIGRRPIQGSGPGSATASGSGTPPATGNYGLSQVMAYTSGFSESLTRSQNSPFLPSPSAEAFRPGSYEGGTRILPIGTPPTESYSKQTRQTSQNYTASPFSAPGSRAVFPSTFLDTRSQLTSVQGNSMDNLASVSQNVFSSSVVGAEFASMGRDIWGQRTSSSPLLASQRASALSPSRLRPTLELKHTSDVFIMSDAEEDDDDHGEEFLPSSLNELLTPKERARRMSRRDSNQSAGAVGIRMGWNLVDGDLQNQPGGAAATPGWERPNIDLLLNRQALSASATTGFRRDVWGDDSTSTIRGGRELAMGSAGDKVKISGFNVSPTTSSHSSALSSMFNPGTTASSTQSIDASHPHSHENIRTAPPDTGFSLGPSNSSLAFLSQLTSRPAGSALDGHKMSHSPSRPSPLHTAIYDTDEQRIRRPGPVPARSTLAPNPLSQPMLSPGARALQSHAPGQSLPQGLAAGLSRLHLQSNRTSARQALGAGTSNFSPAGSVGDNSVGGGIWEDQMTYERVTMPMQMQMLTAQEGKQSTLPLPISRPVRLGHQEIDEDDLFEMDG